jgi:hypothetical protein
MLLEEIAVRLDAALQVSTLGDRIFFGHGASPLWRELKDFVADRLKLPWEDFNRTPVAGYTTARHRRPLNFVKKQSSSISPIPNMDSSA